MKSNKVLLGLFVGFFALAGGVASAQTAFHGFHEIGPSNVAGQVSSLVLDLRDESHTTIYAGAISGGLFVRSSDDDILNGIYNAVGRDASLASNHNVWHQIPCTVNGQPTVLPITTMVQGPDNTIYIGTGDNTYSVGRLFGRMSVLGKGIYRYNPDQVTFTLIPGTKPDAVDHRFAAVKEVDYLYRNNKLYFFAVTGTGLYRWVINSEADWATVTPTEVFNGVIDDLQIVRGRRMAFFSVGNRLYKIGDLTANTINPVEISASNSAFGGTNTSIKLAVAPSDPTYLYAMVIDANGRMENLYLTTNEQDWTTLATSTVIPMTTGAGNNCGAMAVDPENPSHIFIGGTTIWSGEGHIAGSYYQWIKSSYSESELNYGDYMSSVFSNYMFVHSGIHQILPVHADGVMNYYIATDGGVFSTTSFNFFENLNLGLNTTQINHLDVSPDGSVVSGAVSNSVMMVEPRLTHNAVRTAPVWYDSDTNSMFNHDANIIFIGNGGRVAASMFQQVKPQQRRQIMVSNNEGAFGRTYADYLDFTNTQTWTYGAEFVTNTYSGSNSTSFGDIYLWETTENTIFDDTITVSIDTLGYVLRKRSGSNSYDTVWMSLGGMTTGGILVRNEQGRVIDTIAEGTGHGATFQIKRNDKVMFTSRAHSDYPFEYTFQTNQLANQPVSLRNPIQARGVIVARDSVKTSVWRVCISPRATDFTKVYDESAQYAQQNIWYPIFEVQTGNTGVGGLESESGYRPRAVSMSSDGTVVFIAVNDIKRDSSMIVRVSGFENAKYTLRDNDDYKELSQQLSAPRGTLPDGTPINGVTVLTLDTLRVNGSKWFPRQISSIMTDTNDNAERLIVTFDGYNSNYQSVAIVNSCTTDGWNVTPVSITGHTSIPAFCSMVERTTGDLYVGTSDGVFYRHGNVWNVYDNLQGVTVTTMKQQHTDFPVVHTLGHNGINPLNYVFAKTKWPNAMYFGTYGRGIFVDLQYVTDTTNEVVDSVDLLDIPTVRGSEVNSVKIYPNPVVGEANLVLNNAAAGNATLRIYDLNGRCVMVRQLGNVAQGEQIVTIGTEGLTKGMYLVNVIIGGHTSVAKMMVR